MKQTKQKIEPGHIWKGIEKYGGEFDQELKNAILDNGYDFTPYVFKDGRVMCVEKNDAYGLLYQSQEDLINDLETMND